jgi:hypothetical protein
MILRDFDELALAGELFTDLELEDDDETGELLGPDPSVERVTVAEAKRRALDFQEV